MPAPMGHAPYAGCETGGREKIYDKEFIENEADEFMKWMAKPDSLFYKRFCFDRGYSPQRLTEWAQVNEKFSDAYEQSKHWQELRISEGALNNQLNGGFSKFFMSNVCNWSEKSENKISGDADNPLSFLITNMKDTRELVDDSCSSPSP